LEGPSGEASSHELDAATAALTAALYLAGLHEELGDPDEGVIVMPRRGLSPREVRAALLSLASDP
jgi:predicted nuclease with RNAse H fold